MRLTVDVVIPVYNEEKDLPKSVVILHEFLEKHLSNPWRILIADNGSTDGTLAVAEMLSQKYAGVSYLHLDQKGRGRALKRAWLESPAEILTYMDVDLSSDIDDFPKLVQAIEEGYDLAIGSRLARGAMVRRSLRREIISRIYNVLIKLMFRTRFSDAQCGFKAISRKMVGLLMPLVVDTGFFFDTELLILAHKHGLRIKDMPVRWIEDPDTRVNIPRTILADLRGLFRLRFKGIPEITSENGAQNTPNP